MAAIRRRVHAVADSKNGLAGRAFLSGKNSMDTQLQHEIMSVVHL
jgi:hypothetical protein